MKPTSTIYDLLSALSTLPGIYQNSSVLAYPSVVTMNRFENQTICSPGQTIKTSIKFRRNYGNLPPISFYANLIRYGSLYFEVTNYVFFVSVFMCFSHVFRRKKFSLVIVYIIIVILMVHIVYRLMVKCLP